MLEKPEERHERAINDSFVPRRVADVGKTGVETRTRHK
jgi:hypothetical protein